MAHFLWVEDFPGDNSTRSTTEALFGEYLKRIGITVNDLPEDSRILRDQLKPHGIHIETNFYDGYSFIHKKLNTVDFVVLDIDLPCDDGYLEDNQFTEVIARLIDWKYLAEDSYNNEVEISAAQAQFKKIAGYHLYTELVINIGFPKENILFCSNHGEELKTITEAFNHAKIGIPRIYKKSESQELHKSIQNINNNPYYRLRRGILIAAYQYKPHLERNKHITRFSQKWNLEQGTYKNSYFLNYLSLLEMILPIREPDNNKKKHTYKLLFRTIVHNWDQTTEKIDKKDDKYWYSLIKILKNSRNWTAHNRKAFDNLTETFLAFIFLVHMRSTFKGENELANYEIQLLSLLGQPLDQEELEQKLESIDETLHYIYEDVVRMTDDSNNDYGKIINTLQENPAFNPPDGNYDSFFQTSLYRMLWFFLSQDGPHNNFKHPKLNPDKSELELFINTLERYIFRLSFPNS